MATIIDKMTACNAALRVKLATVTYMGQNVGHSVSDEQYMQLSATAVNAYDDVQTLDTSVQLRAVNNALRALLHQWTVWFVNVGNTVTDEEYMQLAATCVSAISAAT